MMMDIRHKSVLIVDDNDRMLRALERVLLGEGCHVTSARSVGDALKILSQRGAMVDLVITDLWMPAAKGLTGLHAMHDQFPNLPVMALTACGSPDVKAACLAEGVAVLEKPMDTPQFLNAVGSVFSSQHRR